MFKEILQIIPRLSPGDLNNMERSLSSRFTRVAKKFGKGLGATLMGGGVAGAALGLIDKILNPLQETQDAIDRTLKAADDLSTNAKQFNSTTGNLARLRAMAQASGLEASDLDMLISKFQGAVAEAHQDPKKQTSVRQFANDKDMVESFFEFIQSLQKLDKNQQRLVQAEVFGEKQVLKMADFLNTPDWFKLARDIGPFDSGQISKSADKLADLNDTKDRLKARQDLKDLITKGSIINEGMVRAQAARQAMETKRENLQIKSYNDLAAISMAAAEVTNLVRNLTLSLTGAVVKFYDLEKNVRKLTESPAMRGIMKFIGGG